MELSNRIKYFEELFIHLQRTNSLNEKAYLVNKIPDVLQDDWLCILQILSGKFKLGYTYYKPVGTGPTLSEGITICDVYNILRRPLLEGDLSNDNVASYIIMTIKYADFLEPLVNRKLRLGIGPSLLPKGGLYPMLGKKYEGKLATSKDGYIVTEKLDGNRCIAHYDGNKWLYTSRNGKHIKVNFDMSNMPTDRVYDGEILSPEQVTLSRKIFDSVKDTYTNLAQFTSPAMRTDFNKTSGLINSNATNKNLIYNIFDIIDDDMTYMERREFIDKLEPYGNNVRILPVLMWCRTQDILKDNIADLLAAVVSAGAEGLMINLCSAKYEHKRTNVLLKYKEVQTMDMYVTNTYAGTGKYADCVGGIHCVCKLDDERIVDVNVGSGLSDEQRYDWCDDTAIVGKIVEIEYFALSQSKDMIGTKLYSLTFPRLKRVRDDKNTTSEY